MTQVLGVVRRKVSRLPEGQRIGATSKRVTGPLGSKACCRTSPSSAPEQSQSFFATSGIGRLVTPLDDVWEGLGRALLVARSLHPPSQEAITVVAGAMVCFVRAPVWALGRRLLASAFREAPVWAPSFATGDSTRPRCCPSQLAVATTSTPTGKSSPPACPDAEHHLASSVQGLAPCSLGAF